MTSAILTPVMTDLAERVGRKRYRKKILPIGKITYKGQKIDFNKEYLQDLVQSFTDVAYDQVPFVLADERNAHNELPERFRGELDSLELTDDGLYGIVAVNKDGGKILESNPDLGVSARIIEGLGKSDGRTFKRAIRHVCGTLDPVVSGLGPWQPVDLSDEVDDHIETVDLSTAHFTEGIKEMATKAKTKPTVKTGGRAVDLSKLSDEQFQNLLDLSTALAESAVEGDVELDEDGEPIVRNDAGERIDPVTGEVIPEPEGDEGDEGDEPELDEDGNPVEKPEPKPVDKTAPPKRVKKKTTVEETDLSVLDQQTRDDVQQMRIDLAAERFATQKKEMIAAGVPPFLIDLAEPILTAPEGAVLDLSNSDDPVSATEVVTQMLDGFKGLVDLTPEIGHRVDLSETTDEDKALMDQWDSEYGSVTS